MADVFMPHPLSPDYLANSNGNIIKKLKNSHKVLKGCVTCEGYINLHIMNKTIRKHRFVYECWKGLIPEGMQIDHIDGNPSNNKLSNLQALSPQEHSRKTREQNLFVVYPNRRRPLQRIHPDGTVDFFENLDNACLKTGIRRDTLLACLCGQLRSHRGCTWQYTAPVVIEGEIWCSLYGRQYNQLQVSSKGRIRFQSGRVSYGFLAQGYQAVRLDRRYKVHRLICLAFHGHPPSSEYSSVDHIDNTPSNNCIENLRWATMKMQNNNKR